jgi:cytochrome c553
MAFFKQAFNFARVLAIMWTAFFLPSLEANELTAVEKKAAACFSCHGDKGKSLSPQVPVLAAQQSVYIVNQLTAFKTDERNNPTMQAQAKNLSEEDINNFGAYFAVQEAFKAGGDDQLAKQGKSKSTICLGCHGAAGEGVGGNPRLAGQHPVYLAVQLVNFKNGFRKHGAMQAIAANLSEEEINALAAFFGGL